MRKATLLPALAVTAVLGVSVALAGAGKLDLLGPKGLAYCDGSGILQGAPGAYGFAVINASSDGNVAATVSLKKLRPNTKYGVRLIQGSADCGKYDAVFTTNAQGNGTVRVSEPSVSDRAFVFVVAAGVTEYFVSETYWY